MEYLLLSHARQPNPSFAAAVQVRIIRPFGSRLVRRQSFSPPTHRQHLYEFHRFRNHHTTKTTKTKRPPKPNDPRTWSSQSRAPRSCVCIALGKHEDLLGTAVTTLTSFAPWSHRCILLCWPRYVPARPLITSHSHPVRLYFHLFPPPLLCILLGAIPLGLHRYGPTVSRSLITLFEPSPSGHNL